MNSSMPRVKLGGPRLALNPIARLVQLSIGASATGMLLMVGGTAWAQVTSPPPGAQYGYAAVGAAGAAGVSSVNGGVGGVGGTSASLSAGFGYTGSFASTVFAITTTGGVGGVGANGSDSSAAGGNGGTGGAADLSFVSGAITGTALAPTLLLTSTGGNGGVPGTMGYELGTPGKAGDGGAGGNVSFVNDTGGNTQINASQGWNGQSAGATAVLLQTTGGEGGAPSSGAQSAGSVDGAVGGNGGDAGTITATIGSAAIQSQGSGLVAISQGGAGNAGAQGTGGFGKGAGGKGGTGGDGGNITLNFQGGVTVTAIGAPTPATGAQVPLGPDGEVAQASQVAAAVLAQSLGGVGGAGGGASGIDAVAGAGGPAGNGGGVSLTASTMNISTTGYSAPGIVLQSVGGSGGNGANAGGAFGSHQGNGAPGGTGATVSATLADSTGTGYIATTGDDSVALVAQSIGGGGGMGGSVQAGSAIAGVTIGGNGESGGDAGLASVYNGQAANGSSGLVIKTTGAGSSALVAQSIGGGGGTAGSAGSSSIGVFNYVVGGVGGNGGDAGVPGSSGATWVAAENNGIVSTSGNHAKGLVAQAVGGGGGDGGSALSQTSSTVLDINVAVGGNGGNVEATNSKQILTSRSDAWGVLAQSVGGGGGNGGSSTADSWVLAPQSPVPTLSIVVSVGGNGQSGGDGGNVTATNNGLIMTSGAGAHGLMAQSIGGGGGNGGDSSLLNEAIGNGDAVRVNVNLGGTGAQGGSAGSVSATNGNDQLIWTTGEGARGIFAQSVSGGGGSGGTATNASDFLKKTAAKGVTITMNLGGDGGGGGDNTTVTATNNGAILTQGNAGDAIFAQSVGGGGGLGGAAPSQGAPTKSNATYTIGGSSASGANGGTANATNVGTIVTLGGSSAGIYAQSVGGGGGKAGTAATNGIAPATLNMQDFLGGSAMAAYAASYADNTLAWKPYDWVALTAGDLAARAADYQAANAAANGNNLAPTDPPVQDLEVSIGLGAGDGSATVNPNGNGGSVVAVNKGTVQTNGPLAAGIWAQSVGGGGGDAGFAAVAATSAGSTTNIAGAVTVGGQGLNKGNGLDVTASNTQSIATVGDASYGILAQSVGGGGGHAATSDSANSQTTGTSTIAIGGSGNVHGNGGPVTVNPSATDNPQATITTQGNDAIGILAQSIGGGGGTALVMHTATDKAGNLVSVTNPTILAGSIAVTTGSANLGPKSSNGPFCVGYAVAACGNGGSVTVNSDSVSTQGRNAHGVLAQSIGGGGGALLGVTMAAGNPFPQGASASGNGGPVSVTVDGQVQTIGVGAYGVLAQSVGGGGFLGGDLGAAVMANATGATTGSFPAWSKSGGPYTKYMEGSGGAVTVNVQSNASVITTGASAHAIFAQSVGGGGGLFSAIGGSTTMGTLGYTADSIAGPIAINVGQGALVKATGTGATAVFTNSEGMIGGTTDVTVTNSGSIVGNNSAPAVLFTGNGNSNGNGSLVNNSGAFIWNQGGTAIAVSGIDDQKNPSFAVVNNYGNIIGDLQLGGTSKEGAGTLNNYYLWAPGANSTVPQVNNAANAAINLGATMAPADTPTSTLNGNLNSSGNFLTTMDFSAQTASSLHVVGAVSLNAGEFLVTIPQNGGLAPNSLTVLNADYGATIAPGVTAVNAANTSVTYSVTMPIFNSSFVQLTPSTQFAAVGASKGYSASQLSMGAHLDAGFTKDMSPAMSRVYGRLANLSDAKVQGAMDGLGNEAVQSVGIARMAASQDFVERMNSCPQFGPGGLQLQEQDCVWSRAVGDQARHDGSPTTVGYKSDVYKVQVGGQRGIGDGWFIGGSFGYDHGSLSASQTSLSGGGWTGALIAKKQVGDWIFSGVVDAGAGRYDSTRQVSLGDFAQTATASLDESHVGLHGRVARQFAMDGWYLKPYVDVHAIRLHTGAYDETGAGELNLQMSGASGMSYVVSPMLEAGSLFNLDNGIALRGYVSAGIAYASQNNWGATGRLQGSVLTAGTFTTTSELPSGRAKLNIGVDLIASKNLDVRVEYSGEFAHAFRSNGAMLKAAYSF